MKFYKLKSRRPSWVSEPATNRQIKLLRFFQIPVHESMAKGTASGIIGRLFQDPVKRKDWEKYVYLTGDEGQESPELVSFDHEELENVVVPDGWKPKRIRSSSKTNHRLRELIIDLLKEGSPFDDPKPKIEFLNKKFVFTGKFQVGTRKECQSIVTEFGGIPQSNINSSTDYLVIGDDGSEHWAEGSHGRKIEKAMISRMEKEKPIIISEGDWCEALNEVSESDKTAPQPGTNNSRAFNKDPEVNQDGRTVDLRSHDELSELGIDPESENYAPDPATATAGLPLVGKTFVITGNLSAPRPEFKKLIEDHGGKVSGSVSTKTDYLLAGEGSGSKQTKAESLGVPVIGEEELRDMLGN